MTAYQQQNGVSAERYRVLVIGVGGGGCNAVSHMADKWTDGPPLAAVNTDAQALDKCRAERKIQIGKSLTVGLSAGGDLTVGKLAAEEDADVIRELVSGYDLIFIVSALGGGTGTGATPVVSRIACEEGALTIIFAALPFSFEGERRIKQADEGIEFLRQNADVVITMPNQMLPDMVGRETSLLDAFGKVDQMVGVAIKTMWRLLAHSGIINLDFADVRQLVENSGGSCRFGYGEGRGVNRIVDAMADVLRGPLLDRGKVLASAPALLVNVIGGSDLSLADIQKIMSQITALASPGVKLFMGAVIDDSWGDRVSLTILAADQWEAADVPNTLPPTLVEAVPDRVSVPPKVQAKNGVRKRKKEVQITMDFDATMEKGRFKDVEPTIHEGEDLDLPTYLRRGIKLSFEK